MTAESRSVSVILPVEWLLTSNQRVHHMVRSTRTHSIRDAFKNSAADVAPLATPVEVLVELEFRRAHRRDAPNWWVTAKAAIDGLVDSGVIADDSDRHVTRTVIPAHTVNPQLPERHVRLTITLTETRP